MQLTINQAKALARLESHNSQDWQELKAVLISSIEHDRNHMQEASVIETVYRLQGRCSATKDLLDLIKDSKSLAQQYS